MVAGDPGIDGPTLRRVLGETAQHLRAHRAMLNAINVYPVPDGDTGSNMSATFDEAVAGLARLDEGAGCGEILAAFARAALYGARGNSGVILSQALRGLAEGARDRVSLDGAALATALGRASDFAYKAVAEPREGTMLTVLREAAEGASAAANAGSESFLAILDTAIERAESAEAATMEQLPQLKEAGVPDSGGEGICVILRGIRAALRGEPAPVEEVAVDNGGGMAFAAAHAEEEFGYCVEFMVTAGAGTIDDERLRDELLGQGCRSVVVIGGDDVVRVHVHADAAETAIGVGECFGEVSHLKVDDMGEQASRLASRHAPTVGDSPVLALSGGPGFDRAFREFGATVAPLGELVKPSAGDIARAADAMALSDVIVLPNHENVLLSARQAVELTQCNLHVVPTKTLPEGLAALLSYSADASVEENVHEMSAALASVATVEVTQATADRTADGVQVRANEFIALLDGRLVASRQDAVDSLVAGLQAGRAGEASLVTVFQGKDADNDETALAQRLGQEFEGVELELVDAGQGLYVFIASIE